MRRLLPLGLAASVLLAGCATISEGLDAINPFSPSGPKMAELKPIETKLDVRTVWSAGLGKAGDYSFVPAVAGNAVFTAANDGTLTKLVDGKVAWKIPAGQPLSAGVGTDGRMLVVGTAKGDVLAFSADDGKALWKARVSSEVLAPPAVGPEGVAVRSGDHRVALLNLADGSRKWVYQRTLPPLALRNVAPPVFSDRYVFVGFPGGKLAALALGNGALIWEGTVAQPRGATELDRVADIVTTPVVDGTQICAVAYQGRVACFDLGQGGTLVWSRDLSSAAGLVLDGRYLFVTDDKGAIHALDRLTGASMWKQDRLQTRRVTGPAVRRGVLVVGDAEGIVHVLSRDEGAFLARVKTDGTPLRQPPVPMASGFVVQTSGGYVGMIEPQ